jgi:hypothetical protein
MSGKTKLFLSAICFVSILSCIPPAAGFLFAPHGMYWTGINSRNTADFNSYLSMVEEIRQDGWKARNLFTAEPHPPFQIRPVHILMGMVGKLIPRIDSVVILSSAQIIFSFLLILILAAISTGLFQDAQDRIPVFLILCLGSGLGWTYLVPDPPDLRIVETSTFLTLLSPPIYTVSLSLILGIIFLQWKAWESSEIKSAIPLSLLSGIFALWLGFERPFSLANLFVATGGSLLIQGTRQHRIPWRALALAMPLCLGSVLALTYQVRLLQEIPIFAEWGRQSILGTPEATRLLMALGLLIPFALYGLKPMFSHVPILGSILVSYILGSLLYSHLPIPFQERFLEGLPVILSILASFGIIRFKNHFRSAALRKIVLSAVILILSPSGIMGWLSDITVFERGAPPQYLPATFLNAMRKLNVMAASDEAIFSSHMSGNFIPSYSARPVVIGHSIATPRFLETWRLVIRFFQLSADDPKALQILNQTRTSWVFWGPEEAFLARGGFDPEKAPFLRREFNNGTVKIYRVLK